MIDSIDRGCKKVMAYGITSEAQLIDINAIRMGCAQYVDDLDYFVEAGEQICGAGDICSSKALSVDDSSMQQNLYDLGQAIAALADSYASAANDVYAQAVSVYNAQVAELQAYYQSLENQKNQNNNTNNNG